MKTQPEQNKRQQLHINRRGRVSKRTSRLWKVFRRLSQLLLIVFLLALGWIGLIQWQIQLFPQRVLPAKVDVGIVLGASLRKDLPSQGLQERLDLALELYRQGRFQRLIVSGGLDNNGSKLTEAEGMRNYLVKNGIPPNQILLEPRATSTYENLLFSKQIMEANSLVSSIIITHHFHGSRSLDIAETIGLQQPIVATRKSEALFMPYHEARETLAYTKWEMTKLLLIIGW